MPSLYIDVRRSHKVGEPEIMHEDMFSSSPPHQHQQKKTISASKRSIVSIGCLSCKALYQIHPAQTSCGAFP